MASNLDALTGLRFFAALWVVLFHVAPRVMTGAPDSLVAIVSAGHVAVTMFFILSGLVLANAYVQRNPREMRAANIRSFWWARVARIYPLYLISLVAVLPFVMMDAWRIQPSWSNTLEVVRMLLLALPLGQAWVPGSALALNYPAWSLSAEVFYYALFPMLLGCVAWLSWRQTAVLGSLAWGLSVAGPAMYLLFLAPGWDANTDWNNKLGFWPQLLSYNPVVRLPEFVIGVLLGVKLKWIRSHCSGAVSGWFATAGIIAVLLASAVSPRVPAPLLESMFVPLFALVLVSIAAGGGVVSRMLSLRPIVLLGESSFGIYILQAPVLGVLSRIAHKANLFADPVDNGWFVAGYVVVLVAVAIVTLVHIERPSRRSLRNWHIRSEKMRNARSLEIGLRGELELVPPSAHAEAMSWGSSEWDPPGTTSAVPTP